MATNPSNAANEAEREIIQSRVFDAPRTMVFDAFTDAEHISQWWGPNGFTTTTQEKNAVPGGVWRFVMHAPGGQDFDNLIAYIEVVRPERLVYHHGAGENDPGTFHVTVTFTEQAGKTTVTMRALFSTAEQCAQVKSFGAVEGGKQTLERLSVMLAAR